MARRKAHHLRARGPQTWQLTWELPPDPVTGQRRRRYETVHGTRKEAEAYWVQVQATLQAAQTRPAAQWTLDALWQRWIHEAKVDIRPTTRAQYRWLWEKRVGPRFGAMRLADLSALAVQTAIQEWHAAGLARNTIRLAVFLLKALCDQAVAWQLLPANPLAGRAVRLPRPDPKPWSTWTPEQARQFLAVADQDRYGLIWRMVLLTGLRMGEVLGLQWADLDEAQQCCWVRHTLIVVKGPGERGQVILGEPKTDHAHRAFPLGPDLWRRLQAHRAQQAAERLRLGPAYRDHGLVFQTQAGLPLHPRNVARRFAQCVAQAGVPYIRPHDLRHTHATWLRAAGADLRLIADQLGHSDVRFTAQVYVHADLEARRPYTRQLETWLAANVPPTAAITAVRRPAAGPQSAE